MSAELLEALWAPISPDQPAGADLTLDLDLDEIRAARKGDDPSLAQGDWVRETRPPQWGRVRELGEGILRGRSKDLQVACWHAEALTMLDGLGGASVGLTAIEGLLDRYWESCHPALEGGSAEERIGRIEWLDANLAAAVKQVPLTSAASGGLCWLKWEEARTLDNLGLRNPQAKQEAIAEGKIPGEVFQKAVLASGPGFYRSLQEQAEAAQESCRSLQASLDRHFGADGPGLESLAEALRNCLDMVVQTRQKFFPARPEPAGPGPAPAGPGPELPVLAPGSSGILGSRQEAIASLRATAHFFRSSEPHSPVAFLVERAASWAEMPLDSWLSEVIKDGATLAQLRELLNLKQGNSHDQLDENFH
jgi:type VI secretion system protein ImpA